MTEEEARALAKIVTKNIIEKSIAEAEEIIFKEEEGATAG